MSLVAYGNSSDSEEDTSDTENATAVKIPTNA